EEEEVKEESSSSISTSRTSDAADAATMMMTAELAKMYEAHVGPATDYIQTGIRQAVQDLGPELAKAIVETCIDNGAQKWAYIRAAVTKAKEQGITTVEAYQGGHMRAKGAIVDRATPSGNNILARGIGRPLRLKREE
ncbi:DnaD domain protein, partial [Allofournierella sp.]|uniref:DnaD domain protein n=1 Tax=Allofournierella sp. TaxID=1940256 RepID=UPI003AEF6100